VRSYLLRCGFTSTVSQVASFDPPYSDFMNLSFEFQRGRNPMVMELTKIEQGSALPALLNQVVWVLRHRLKYRKYDAYDVATAMSEICQNTFDHNQDTCGFMAMQGYGRGSGRFIEIAVADYGEGLRTTLSRNARNGSIRSDSEAIQMATRLGTSEYDDPTRGTGLYHLLEIAYKHQGSVQFRSGSAKTRFRMDKRQGWSFYVPHLPGLQITLTLRSKERA
jgi:anti-sigma regulatory factor (Ser/Thr protein kinase)